MLREAKRPVGAGYTGWEELFDREWEFVEEIDAEPGVDECCDDLAEWMGPGVRNSLLKPCVTGGIATAFLETEGLIGREVWAANGQVCGAAGLFEDAADGVELHDVGNAARPKELRHNLRPPDNIRQSE